jgi:phosphatidylserine/phosphatidylglycerophosphate/cardiolipin synthase-like enzyme
MTKATALFSRPQHEIRSVLEAHMKRAAMIRIVTGFATPGGVSSLRAALASNYVALETLVVGAGTYPAFEALDLLSAAGVPVQNMFVHLGHTKHSGTRKKPTVRFHPMLHSKIYYMEYDDGSASAFVGSHNMTAFALNGMNGEASVLLEGATSDPAFSDIRKHIDESKRQAIQYHSGLKSALAWWTREFIDGMKAEVQLPNPDDWRTVRTIVILAETDKTRSPQPGSTFTLS